MNKNVLYLLSVMFLSACGGMPDVADEADSRAEMASKDFALTASGEVITFQQYFSGPQTLVQSNRFTNAGVDHLSFGTICHGGTPADVALIDVSTFRTYLSVEFACDDLTWESNPLPVPSGHTWFLQWRSRGGVSKNVSLIAWRHI